MCFVKPDVMRGATDAYNAGETSYNGYALTNDKPTGWGSGFAHNSDAFLKSDGHGPGTIYFKNAPSNVSVVRDANGGKTYMPPGVAQAFAPTANPNQRIIS